MKILFELQRIEIILKIIRLTDKISRMTGHDYDINLNFQENYFSDVSFGVCHKNVLTNYIFI